MNVITWLQKLASNWHILLLLAIVLGYGWIMAGYAVMFWHTRHEYALKRMAGWTMYCGMLGYYIYYFTWLDEISLQLAAVAFGVQPLVAVYKRWVGRANEPGYPNSREMLLLRPPGESFQHDLAQRGR